MTLREDTHVWPCSYTCQLLWSQDTACLGLVDDADICGHAILGQGPDDGELLQLNEDDLRVAVRFAMRRNVSLGRPASAWVAELSARDELLHRVRHDRALSDEEVGWAGQGGERAYLMGERLAQALAS